MTVTTSRSWPTAGLSYGGDYNPEQWPEEIWRRDAQLMREAGIDFATVGVFAWARLQPTPEQWDFGWLDRVLDLLHEHDVRVDLATATASPPPWLTARHPEVRPVDERGYRYEIGSRQTWSTASTAYREHSLVLVRRLAERYGDHPALAMWHVSNELGCHNSRCYSDASAAAFRAWLIERYGDLDELNAAWATTFWSQRYSDWAQIRPPAVSTALGNPTQLLDWRRYCSDALLAQYLAERDVLREITPDVPITTNFMVGMGNTLGAPMGDMDYAQWAPEQDIVSTDHYLVGPTDGEYGAHSRLAYAADHTRGLAGGRPWLLMEHSPSAVNWQPVNLAKRPGAMLRDSLTHVARGADGIAFFQFRQSVAGAEKFHSALLPHAGEDSARWRESVALGAALRSLAEVRGSRVDAPAAIVFDWPSQWVSEQECRPSALLQHDDMAFRAHRAFTSIGVTCDVVGWDGLTADSGHRVVVVPAVCLVSDEHAERITELARAGTHVVVTAFSGICDERDHVRLGGYPGAFRELLGVRSEEFFPLLAGDRVTLTAPDGTTTGDASLWTEDLTTGPDTDVLARYADGPLPGVAALTRRTVGEGAAWYLATVPSAQTWRSIAAAVAEEAGAPRLPATPEVEIVRRSGEHGRWLFLFNHSEQTATVHVRGHDLLTGVDAPGPVQLPPGGCAVLREEAPCSPTNVNR